VGAIYLFSANFCGIYISDAEVISPSHLELVVGLVSCISCPDFFIWCIVSCFSAG
jgi:hypothetical protein